MEDPNSKLYEQLLSFREIAKNAENIHSDLLKEQSNLDLAISDIYHYIEFTDCSVTDIVRLHYVLKDILKKRRKVKNLAPVTACLIPTFNCSKGTVLKQLSNFGNDDEKYYNVRTDILTKALGDKAPAKDSKFSPAKNKGEE